MNIANKVVIVTGGTGGIGLATVQTLLQQGVKHVASFDLEATKRRVVSFMKKVDETYGKGRVAFYACDVTNKYSFAEQYDKVVKSQKTVDVLINNAGILCDIEGDKMIDVNLKGLVNCTLTAIDRMGKHKNGKGGTILNVASIAGLLPFPALPIYIATKYGVYGFTQALKEHYGHTGVRTLTMCPGVTESYFMEKDWQQIKLNFVQDRFIDDLRKASEIMQPAGNVGAAIVKMIQEAESGAVWISDENEPPYAVASAPHYKDRKC